MGLEASQAVLALSAFFAEVEPDVAGVESDFGSDFLSDFVSVFVSDFDSDEPFEAVVVDSFEPRLSLR